MPRFGHVSNVDLGSTVCTIQIIIQIIIIVSTETGHRSVRFHLNFNEGLTIPSDCEILGFDDSVDAQLIDVDCAERGRLNLIVRYLDVVDQRWTTSDKIDGNTVVLDEDVFRTDLSAAAAGNVLSENTKLVRRVFGQGVLALASETVVEPVEGLIVRMAKDRTGLRADDFVT